MPAIRSIVFDLDGTLVDSLPGIEYSAHRAIAAVCPEKGRPGLRSFIGPPVREVLRRALGFAVDAPELDALNAAFRRSYDDDGWSKAELYPGAADLLRALRGDGRRCFVLTNKPAPATDRILRHLGVREVFEQVVAPDPDAPLHRNKTAAARALQETAGLVPPVTLLVGDSRDDAAAAEACGFAFAAIGFGYGDAADQREYPVHFRLRSFPELADILFSPLSP